MKTPSEPEVLHIAAGIRLTGELLEAHGSRAIAATQTWSRGPRSPLLDPTTAGTPVEPDDGITPDPDRETHQTLLRLLARIDQDAHQLRRILHAVAGTTIATPDPDTPAQVSAAGWCISCWRDDHWCEPVAMRPDGRRRYRDYCTWCGETIAARSELASAAVDRLAGKARKTAVRRIGSATWLPPLELVVARHRGQRITRQMMETAIATDLKAA